MRRAWFPIGTLSIAALSFTVLSTGLAAAPALAGDEPLVSLETPAGPGSMAPNLAPDPDGPLLTWLEPNENGPGHALYVARLGGDRWGDPVAIQRGDAFFANWADVPGVARLPGGELVAHWLAKLGDDTYAYGVHLALSTDGGRTWTPRGLLHDDRSPTEHGFVSYARTSDALWAFWLDGRAMATEGPMGLRATRVGAAGPAPSELIDERVCECCQTDAAATAAGPVVVYRNRSDTEIRDIWIARRDHGRWSEPRAVAEDGWEIPGCPVNGPAVAARERTVVVVWFTGAGGPAVRAAVSSDGGATFGPALTLDDTRPVGRVDVVLAPGGALATWLDRGEAGTVVRTARIDLAGAGARVGPVRTLMTTSDARSSGFPRLAPHGTRVVIAWVDADEGTRVRTALLDLD